jgi:hypothetical protein
MASRYKAAQRKLEVPPRAKWKQAGAKFSGECFRLVKQKKQPKRSSPNFKVIKGEASLKEKDLD